MAKKKPEITTVSEEEEKKLVERTREKGREFLRKTPTAFGGGIDPETGIRSVRGQRTSVAGEGEITGLPFAAPSLEQARAIDLFFKAFPDLATGRGLPAGRLGGQPLPETIQTTQQPITTTGGLGAVGQAVAVGQAGETIITKEGVAAEEEEERRSLLSGETDQEARTRVLEPLVGATSPAFQSTAAARETLGSEKQEILGRLIPATGGALVLGVAATFGFKAIAPITYQKTADFVKLELGQISPKQLSKGVGAVIGGDVLFTWFAVDNVLSGQPFFLRDINKGLEAGTITIEEAEELIEGSTETRRIAETFAKVSASFNPAMWPFQKLITTGVDEKVLAAELIEEQVNQTIETKKTEKADFIVRRDIERAKGGDLRSDRFPNLV